MKSLFLFNNRFDGATVTASSQTATNEAINVQNPQRSRVWRSLGSSPQHLRFKVLKTGPILYLALLDVNLSAAGTIRIQAWDDAFEGATETLDLTVNPALYVDPDQPTFPYGSGPYGVGPYGLVPPFGLNPLLNITIVPLPAAVSSAYWQITFDDGALPYVQCSRVYAHEGQVFEVNLSRDWEAAQVDRTTRKESLGGQFYSQERDPRRVISASFDALDDDERTQMLITMRRFGKHVPFVFSIYPETTNRGLTTTLYGTFGDVRMRAPHHQLNAMPFSVVEEL